MRLIGNKTHGDLAEIGIAEFIHQFMYDFDSRHVGKDLFRAKEHEEDIVIINELTKEEIPVSLKAYGDGPLQLSTDKDSLMFPKLKEYGEVIDNPDTIKEIFNTPEFASLHTVNVMPLIYREADMECNIMVFDFEQMQRNTAKYSMSIKASNTILHPNLLFLPMEENILCICSLTTMANTFVRFAMAMQQPTPYKEDFGRILFTLCHILIALQTAGFHINKIIH